MATHNSLELAQIAANPGDPVDYGAFGGKVRIQLATVNFAGQLADDVINLFRIPKGGRVVAMMTHATASHGSSSQIRIGDVSNPAKYRTSAILTGTTQTLVSIPSTIIGNPAAPTGPTEGYNIGYSQETTIFLTIDIAALPGTGTAVYTCLYTVN